MARHSAILRTGKPAQVCRFTTNCGTVIQKSEFLKERKNNICAKREKPVENSVKCRKSIRISGKLGINI
jgi:hypothetical protein